MHRHKQTQSDSNPRVSSPLNPSSAQSSPTTTPTRKPVALSDPQVSRGASVGGAKPDNAHALFEKPWWSEWEDWGHRPWGITESIHPSEHHPKQRRKSEGVLPPSTWEQTPESESVAEGKRGRVSSFFMRSPQGESKGWFKRRGSSGTSSPTKPTSPFLAPSPSTRPRNPSPSLPFRRSPSLPHTPSALRNESPSPHPRTSLPPSIPSSSLHPNHSPSLRAQRSPSKSPQKSLLDLQIEEETIVDDEEVVYHTPVPLAPTPLSPIVQSTPLAGSTLDAGHQEYQDTKHAVHEEKEKPTWGLGFVRHHSNSNANSNNNVSNNSSSAGSVGCGDHRGGKEVKEQQRDPGWLATRNCVAKAVSSVLPVSAIPPSLLTPCPSSPSTNAVSSYPSQSSQCTHAHQDTSHTHPADSHPSLLLSLAHETVALSTPLLRYAPVPGLEEAARVLLGVWDAVREVDTNRLASLRLTSRCATLLYSVREEVHEAGDVVGEELAGPIVALVSALHTILSFLTRQARRPFLKRYLRREEIGAEIEACDRALGGVVQGFGISIQTRILKQVMQTAEEQRRIAVKLGVEVYHPQVTPAVIPADCVLAIPPAAPIPTQDQAEVEGISLLFSVEPPQGEGGGTTPPPMYISTMPSQSPVPSIIEPLDIVPPSTSREATPQPTFPASTYTSQACQTSRTRAGEPLPPLAHLEHLRTTQNIYDAQRDAADWRTLQKEALSAGSDKGMIERLGVPRSEMWEAIRTLRRVLEAASHSEDERGYGGDVSKGVGGRGGMGIEGHLDREFMESGIDAMTRCSRVCGAGVGGREDGHAGWDLPSWTITRYEIDLLQRIGTGFFSSVYLGRWRKHPIAIKVLSPATPRSLFVRETSIWKDLIHPNVLRLYGASSAAGDPPWFFVSTYCRGGDLVGWLRDRRGTNGGSLPVEVGVGWGGSPRNVGLGIPTPGSLSPAHPNVSPLLSPTSLPPSPSSSPDKLNGTDLVRCMHQIANGMEYLHAQGVLHGDLKASNVLVDDVGRCVISDFGQSEMKSEAYRLSGSALPHGTLRWQAPELLSGDNNRLTPAVDAYAFAICCVEILGMGELPWAQLDDAMVVRFVVEGDKRPNLPQNRYTQPTTSLITAAWAREPSQRPSFSKMAKQLRTLRKRVEDSPRPHSPEIWAEPPRHHHGESPDLRPRDGLDVVTGLEPPEPPVPRQEPPDSATTAESYRTAMDNMDDRDDDTQRPPSFSSDHSDPMPFHPIPRYRNRQGPFPETGEEIQMDMPQPVLYTPSVASSRSSSLHTTSPHQSVESILLDGLDETIGPVVTFPVESAVDDTWYESPSPADMRLREARNEMRFRMVARHHDFHHSLNLPLWSPSYVELGAVGYLAKPEGRFVTLFNSRNPVKTSNGVLKDMPSLHGYGRVTIGKAPSDKRNEAQRGFLDTVTGFLTFRLKGGKSHSEGVCRPHEYPLRAGKPAAHIYAEETEYSYLEGTAPRRWFKAHVGAIMQHYGPHHPMQKEDLYLVMGALNAPRYALFVSNNHADGHAYFRVLSNPKVGSEWAMFTIDSDSKDHDGPSYPEEIPAKSVADWKISKVEAKETMNTLLVAKLRFKPDIDEPTSY